MRLSSFFRSESHLREETFTINWEIPVLQLLTFESIEQGASLLIPHYSPDDHLRAATDRFLRSDPPLNKPFSIIFDPVLTEVKKISIY